MDFELTPEQQQVELEVYDYLEKLVTPELEAELAAIPEGGGPDTHPYYTQAMRQLGHDGWLGIGWPKEYGGQNRSSIEQYIFFDAVMGYYRIPIPLLALNTVGPTIMRHGTEEQKKRFLPPILSGELNIAIGYTEPEAGSDLASLKTKAERDGDHYIINGQKIFTSLAHHADYIWLAARTDPNVKKHKGISIFMVDINTPGITVDPLFTMGGFQSNFTYYDNVRVPKDCLIGEENKGWRYINSQLAMERVALVPHSRTRHAFQEMTTWAKENTLDGRLVIDEPWVRSQLAEIAMDIEVLKLFNFRVAWQLTQGVEPFAEASMTKIFGSELLQRVTGVCIDMMGLVGGLQPPSKLAPFSGRYQQEFLSMRLLTFGGGANEVLRDIIALIGLGMPPSR
jgi:hypothetical protein